jgi:hypothetical protein
VYGIILLVLDFRVKFRRKVAGTAPLSTPATVFTIHWCILVWPLTVLAFHEREIWRFNLGWG